MAKGLKSWDTADYLRDKDDICLYLEAAAEEDPGDGSLMQVAMSNIVKAHHRRNLPGDVGGVCDGLQDALSQPMGISIESFMRLLHTLGMRMHLSVPPELEQRLAAEQELLDKQATSIL